MAHQHLAFYSHAACRTPFNNSTLGKVLRVLPWLNYPAKIHPRPFLDQSLQQAKTGQASQARRNKKGVMSKALLGHPTSRLHHKIRQRPSSPHVVVAYLPEKPIHTLKNLGSGCTRYKPLGYLSARSSLMPR